MTDSHEPDDQASTPIRSGLPERTTPTWEVELLISGVAVFAMLQLPGWLDDRFFDLSPRLDQTWYTTLLLGYVYAKSGALILATTFVLHLLMRAHWIALVGVDSIYPDGVRWDRVRLGAQQKEVEQARLGSIPDAIERADNRATVVFAIGVSLTAQMVKLLVLVALMALIALALSPFIRFDAAVFVSFGIAVVIVPMILAGNFDRRFGGKLDPYGIPARFLRRIFLGYGDIGFGSGSNPGMLLVTSNAGPRRVHAITFAVMLASMAIVFAGLFLSRSPDRFGNYGFLPAATRDGERVLLRGHYDDQRGEQRLDAIPYLPSQVIADPYLRVTIPIRPLLHEAALQRQCPAAVAVGAPASARLDCLASMHPVQLDGQPVHARFDLGTDAKAQCPALVAMIDVRALPGGRHELTVGEPGQSDGTPSAADRIPFWR